MIIGAAQKHTSEASSIVRRQSHIIARTKRLQCLYVMLGRVVCGKDDDFALHESQGALPEMIRMQRLISYFGDSNGLKGLMKHVGDEEIICQVLFLLWDERTADHIPYEPFSEWPEVHHEAFKDIILKIMSLDPKKRLAAKQALEHPWFASSC